jgi:hypothetical protein
VAQFEGEPTPSASSASFTAGYATAEAAAGGHFVLHGVRLDLITKAGYVLVPVRATAGGRMAAAIAGASLGLELCVGTFIGGG